MISKYVAAASAALALTVSAPAAQAQDLAPAQRNDLQCFLIFSYMVGIQQDNPETLAGLVGGMSYYFGRLEAADPNRDWLSFVETNVTYAEGLVGEQPAFQRCGAEMVTLGNRMTTFGERMQAVAGG